MKAFKEFVPNYMERIEKCLKQNGDGKGFLVGTNVSTENEGRS
jgi:hypothetical protein